MATISLAAGSTPCPNVIITITGLTAGSDDTVNIWRTADGDRAAVRGTRGMTINGSDAITDYEAPVGRVVSYDLEVLTGPDAGVITPTATITVPANLDSMGKPTWWIQDPLVPESAIELAVAKGDNSRPSLTAAAVKSLEYASDVNIIPIAGSNKPVAIGGQRLIPQNVPFDTFTNTAQTTTQLRDLIEQTAVVLIRPPGTDRDAGIPGLFYAAMAKPVAQPITVAFGGTLTKWSLQGSGVAAPTASILVPIWTYGTVEALWNEYQDAQTAYSSRGMTYLDVQKSPTGT